MNYMLYAVLRVSCTGCHDLPLLTIERTVLKPVHIPAAAICVSHHSNWLVQCCVVPSDSITALLV